MPLPLSALKKQQSRFFYDGSTTTDKLFLSTSVAIISQALEDMIGWPFPSSGIIHLYTPGSGFDLNTHYSPPDRFSWDTKIVEVKLLILGLQRYWGVGTTDSKIPEDQNGLQCQIA